VHVLNGLAILAISVIVFRRARRLAARPARTAEPIPVAGA
jgi:hypothetical protein